MRAVEFIRGLLDLIEKIDVEQKPMNDYEDESCGCGPGCDCPECIEQYSNSPGEHYISNDTIMSMGNDVNKPKHPADIRVSTVALYPNTAYRGN